MKKKVVVILLCVMLTIASCSLANSTKEGVLFTPTIAKALKIQNWLSSGINRALLAFSLGAGAADDKVLGRADILMAFMKNPAFVGKDKESNNLVAATITDEDLIFIYYSVPDQKAYVLTFPNESGNISVGVISLERAVSATCSEYYQITKEDMDACIQYIQNQL